MNHADIEYILLYIYMVLLSFVVLTVFICDSFTHFPQGWFTGSELILKIMGKTWQPCVMMTLSNGNTFRITGPLREEFIGHRWIPLTKASDAELWCFFFISAWTNCWVNNPDAGDLRCHHAPYDVTIMVALWMILGIYLTYTTILDVPHVCILPGIQALMVHVSELFLCNRDNMGRC